MTAWWFAQVLFFISCVLGFIAVVVHILILLALRYAPVDSRLKRNEATMVKADDPLASLIKTGRCPDCGHDKWYFWQDGGHDQAMKCDKCGSCFGIHEPVGIVERIKGEKP
jgi:DNA-directed RNA polymerase subunit M/transcription elongation factor TFIIS